MKSSQPNRLSLRPSFLCVIALIATAGAVRPACAQWAVFDAGNFQQNTLNELHTATQITNQARQIANQVQMIQNQSQHLKTLNFTTLTQLLSTIASTARLLDQTAGMHFDLTQTQQRLATTYPSTYGSSATADQMNVDAFSRWSSSHDALSTSMQVQSQTSQNFLEDQAALSSLMTRSSSAVGALQALQATNELLGLHARQEMQNQQIAISQGRADALEQARSVEAEARSRELRKRFMSNSTAYSPQAIHF